MKIDRHLNLVVEIPREGEANVRAHSPALAAEVLEQYHSLAGPTMNALMTRGYGYFMSRYAASVLREVAEEQAEAIAVGQEKRIADAVLQRAKAKVDGFFTEIRRQVHVLSLVDGSWQMVPFRDAIQAGTIDDEEAAQIENALVFFTFGSRSWVKAQREILVGGLSLCNARIESLNCMDLMNFLKTSKPGDSTGANPGASHESSDGSSPAASKNAPNARNSHGIALPRIETVS